MVSYQDLCHGLHRIQQWCLKKGASSLAALLYAGWHGRASGPSDSLYLLEHSSAVKCCPVQPSCQLLLVSLTIACLGWPAGLGPRVVARAWADPEYKERLLADGVSAIKELGISAEGWKPHGGVTGEGRLVLCSF